MSPAAGVSANTRQHTVCNFHVQHTLHVVACSCLLVCMYVFAADDARRRSVRTQQRCVGRRPHGRSTVHAGHTGAAAHSLSVQHARPTAHARSVPVNTRVRPMTSDPPVLDVLSDRALVVPSCSQTHAVIAVGCFFCRNVADSIETKMWWGTDVCVHILDGQYAGQTGFISSVVGSDGSRLIVEVDGTNGLTCVQSAQQLRVRSVSVVRCPLFVRGCLLSACLLHAACCFMLGCTCVS